MSFPALAEVEGKIADRQKKMHDIFDQAGPELDLKKVTELPEGCKTTTDIAAFVRKMNDELSDLGTERDNLKAVQKASENLSQREGGSDDGRDSDGRAASTKSIGELFTKSAACVKGPIGPEATLDVDFKTLMTTSAGWGPDNVRNGRLVDDEQRPIQVVDIIPQTTTTQNTVLYMEETTFTNAAVEVAEGGSYPESALALTEQSSAVRKISTYLPVTDEQLEDVPQVRGYVDNRLPFMIRQRLDAQILTGNGTAPNLRGLLNVVGIQTQAKSTDPTPDAFYKAMVLVQTTGQAQPDTIIANPLDWQDVRLLRTADGIYIWGNPSDVGPQRMWGLRVVLAQALTQNTGVVGDFGNFSELSIRRGLNTQVSNSHSTYFVEGKQAIRADMRAAVVFYRPTAFCTVTGI